MRVFRYFIICVGFFDHRSEDLNLHGVRGYKEYITTPAARDPPSTVQIAAALDTLGSLVNSLDKGI
jgi:hypothetical protein